MPGHRHTALAPFATHSPPFLQSGFVSESFAHGLPGVVTTNLVVVVVGGRRVVVVVVAET